MSDYKIVPVLMRRDAMSLHEAIEAVNEAREMVKQGQNPEGVCRREFGLEPDYAWDLML